MTTRILHVSDLHVGRRGTPEPRSALYALAARTTPELVLATGDLAHRGRAEQLRDAAEFLRGLGAPFLAVPGNHDIPYTFPARFTRTFDEWEHVFGSVAPTYESPTLAVAGLCSVRPWRQQGGALDGAAVERAAAVLRAAPAGALRVVALHHHVASPPWRAASKRPVHGRTAALHAFAEAGAELVVGGHVHQAAIAERREFEVLDAPRQGSLVLATVPGLGRPRPGRRGEALGFNLYEAEEANLTVRTFAWDGRSFGEVGRRCFARLESGP